jgi:hypothetical protein
MGLGGPQIWCGPLSGTKPRPSSPSLYRPSCPGSSLPENVPEMVVKERLAALSLNWHLHWGFQQTGIMHKKCSLAYAFWPQAKERHESSQRRGKCRCLLTTLWPSCISTQFINYATLFVFVVERFIFCKEAVSFGHEARSATYSGRSGSKPGISRMQLSHVACSLHGKCRRTLQDIIKSRLNSESACCQVKIICFPPPVCKYV